MSFKDVIKPKSKEEVEDLKKRGFRNDAGKWKFNISIVPILHKYKKNEDTTAFKEQMIDLLESKITDLNVFLNENELLKLQELIGNLNHLPDNPEVQDLQKSVDRLIDWADDYDIWVESESDDE